MDDVVLRRVRDDGAFFFDYLPLSENIVRQGYPSLAHLLKSVNIDQAVDALVAKGVTFE